MYKPGLKLVTARGTAMLEITGEKVVNGIKLYEFICEGTSGVASEASMTMALYNELESRPTLRVVGA